MTTKPNPTATGYPCILFPTAYYQHG